MKLKVFCANWARLRLTESIIEPPASACLPICFGQKEKLVCQEQLVGTAVELAKQQWGYPKYRLARTNGAQKDVDGSESTKELGYRYAFSSD